MNTLYYGDNLKVLRKYVGDETVDLIYLDPPFNSKRAYNVIFKDQTGKDEAAQIQAFEDTWSWRTHAQDAYEEIMEGKYPAALKNVIEAFKGFLGINNLMAYLVMMAIRLVEMHRVLKNTGSIYLHCDPTASHYLKILMDQIFGVENFKNEIIWKRNLTKKGSQYRMNKFASNADILLFYAKSKRVVFHTPLKIIGDEELLNKYNKVDENGKRFKSEPIELPKMMARENLIFEFKGYKPSFGWMMTKEKLEELDSLNKLYFTKTGKPRRKNYLDDYRGTELDNIWDDIPPIGQKQSESLGYPTQKPIELLERIIESSSNEGDVVMDPFCGCGTAVVAAEKLGRSWIGIDITHLAISLIKKRLRDHFPNVEFTTVGEPESVEAARELFKQSAFQFEAWAVSLLGGQPFKSKGGGDTGIDGLLYFKDYQGKYYKIIIEVKGGGYQPKDVRALGRVLEREQAPLGVLLALEAPTSGMQSEAAALGKWKMPGSNREYPVLQIVTIEDIFAKRYPNLPDTSETLKKAKRELREGEKTGKLKM